MKITFNFDKDTRALALVPEDELESCVLADMAAQCKKGTSIFLTETASSEAIVQRSFRVEMKVNGK